MAGARARVSKRGPATGGGRHRADAPLESALMMSRCVFVGFAAPLQIASTATSWACTCTNSVAARFASRASQRNSGLVTLAASCAAGASSCVEQRVGRGGVSVECKRGSSVERVAKSHLRQRLPPRACLLLQFAHPHRLRGFGGAHAPRLRRAGLRPGGTAHLVVAILHLREHAHEPQA